MWLYCGPHACLPTLVIASANLVPFFVIYCRWEVNRSPLLKMTPRYFTSEDSCIIVPDIVIGVLVCLLPLLLRMKCTRIYLDGSNCAPCLLYHCSTLASIVYNLSIFPSSVSPATPYVMSSMNPKLKSSMFWLICCSISSRSVL